MIRLPIERFSNARLITASFDRRRGYESRASGLVVSSASADSYLPLALVSLFLAILGAKPAAASDHADPIDPFYFQRQEGAITDLFLFPILKNTSKQKIDSSKEASNYIDVVANAYHRESALKLHDPLSDIVRPKLSNQQRNEIGSLVFILCVRRNLSDPDSLTLSPYEFRIKIDVNNTIEFPSLDQELEIRQPGETGDQDHHQGDGHSSISLVESYARYGGHIPDPKTIKEDITISIRLNDDASIADSGLSVAGPAASQWPLERIRAKAGVFDDPFIFPMFFGTNVVGIVIEIPIDLMPADETDYLIWATSHRRSKQVDHVGRSLRTQNPRFELLNTLEPSKHRAALLAEHEHPSLMRDLFLRANFASYFAFRRWDFVPDVMCFSTRYPAGFPNGRLLTDDVAAILAQHGDTLLYELSYQDNRGAWPRQTKNDVGDGKFQASFPYLNPPHRKARVEKNPRLSSRSIAKLLAIAILALGALILENWIVARLYCRWAGRKRS